jgi:dTDP-4-amino-4,6-dideoxygalactose transaminase
MIQWQLMRPAKLHVPFLDLTRETKALRANLDAAAASVLDSGHFVLGMSVEAFEAAFADICGARHAVGVASGTDALTIALQAVGVESGDEVIIPANTCAPTVAAVEAARARPVLADVDARTFTLDPASAQAAVSERTRAIVAVHLYGVCADVDALRELGPPVVEDAAQAHGAALRGRRAGTLSAAAAFSFYPTKNLGALGDGGAVVTNDTDVADTARALRSYGERERYTSERAGWNSRLDELQAALLLAKLPQLEAWTERRRALARTYDAALADSGLEAQSEPEGYRHVRHLYVVAVPQREAFRARLAERGIETLVHYPRPVHGHPAYAALARPGLRESERLAAEVVSLPLYPYLTDEESEAVADVLRDEASFAG